MASDEADLAPGDGEPSDHELAVQLVAAREDQLRALGEARRLTERLERVEAAIPALTRSVQAASRLCESMKRAPSPVLRDWFLRTEAQACAAREGLKCDEVRFLAYMEGAPHEIISRAERTAGDVSKALASALRLDPRAALAVDLVEIWNATEATNSVSKDRRDARQIDVERASESLLAPLEGLARDPSPSGAAEVVRRILLETRFHVAGRMAMVLAPAVVRLGFGAPHALVGVAGSLPPNGELLEAATDADGFARHFYKAVADGAERTTRAALEINGVRESLRGRIGPERNNARTGAALEAFLRRPVMNVPTLAREIGATPKGAQLILERLVGTGTVQVLEPERAKGRLYICRRALLPE